ncbi:MAG: hypothetical protein ACHP7N_15860 [Caulobacterales bacterium]
MQRIVILGCAGSGKSTLARAISQRTGVPLICLDALWPGDLTVEDVPDFRRLIAEAHAGEAWISDGNFAAATFDLRLPRADRIVWLERGRLLCAARASLRVLRSGEAHRPGDLAKVLKFIAGFDRRNRPLIEAERAKHGPNLPVTRLRSDAQIQAFVELFPAKAAD